MKWFHFHSFHPNISRAALASGLATLGAQQLLLQNALGAKIGAGVAGVCLVIAAFSQPASWNAPPPSGPPPPEASGHA